MSSKDLKMRFDSQLFRMNCQIFSWLLSSGGRGGSGKSQMLGILSVLECQSAESCVSKLSVSRVSRRTMVI